MLNDAITTNSGGILNGGNINKNAIGQWQKIKNHWQETGNSLILVG